MPAPTLHQRLAARQRPGGGGVMRQAWERLLFLHWRIDPAIVQATLPPGLTVDTHAGAAWLAVVPFFMNRVRPRFLPPLPWLSWFLELNLRTYVFDHDGNPGVWFYSLDCNQPVAVELARRFFHLPYKHAAMRAGTDAAGRVDYHWQRRGAAPGRFTYAPEGRAAPAEPGSLEFFLCERYLLFAADSRGDLHVGRVHHAPYQLQPASVSSFDVQPFSLAGFAEPTTPAESVLYSARVDVDIFPLRRIH